MSGVSDVQFSNITVTNDTGEQIVYAKTIPGGSITTATRYQVVLTGTISAAAAPGNIAIRVNLGSASVDIVNEALLALSSNAHFTCNAEIWLRNDNVVGLGGFFAQNAAEIFTSSGVRLNSNASALNLTVDQLLTVTVQFSTADPANSFMRSLAALFILTG